jgi:hypothetical protein
MPGPLPQNGKDEQEIGTASQDGTGGFAYQDGAASFISEDGVSQPSFGPVPCGGVLFCKCRAGRPFRAAQPCAPVDPGSRNQKSTFEFCLPTKATTVPSGPDWLHEVKYDGYRVRVERDGDRVRLFSRNGYDWTSRYPWIVEAARKIRQKRFVLDGEAVILAWTASPISMQIVAQSL